MRVLFGTLSKLGTRHVVISPGSRNAPLILGALSTHGLVCHSALDERSAGFFALGLARASGHPVVLICTSGSAVAHYLPAVIEAHHSGVPLFVLSADRPSSLQACGAPQTIDQSGILGGFAQRLAGWDEPSSSQELLLHWARKITQLHHLARCPLPGPVHLNVPLDKPLEPLAPSTPEELELAGRVDRILESTTTIRGPSPSPSSTELLALLRQFAAEPTLKCVAVGPVDPGVARKVAQFARRWSLPLLSELPGIKREIGPDVLARSLTSAPERLQVLHFGPPLVSSRWAQLTAAGEVEQWILPGMQHLDPSARARQILLGDLDATLEQLSHLEVPVVTSRALPSAPRSARQVLAALPVVTSSDRMSEPHAVFCVLGMVRADDNLLLANSLSLRLADWVQEGEVASAHVYTSRGANGIDGWIAQACGVAQATRRASIVLLGDVAAAHDLSSLALARLVRCPLVICVVDNDGGRIFEHLPGARLWPSYPGSEEHFLTSPRLDWMAAGATYGLPTCVCRTLEELRGALELAMQRLGTTVVVARTDPKTTQRFLHALRAQDPLDPQGFQ